MFLVQKFRLPIALFALLNMLGVQLAMAGVCPCQPQAEKSAPVQMHAMHADHAMMMDGMMAHADALVTADTSHQDQDAAGCQGDCPHAQQAVSKIEPPRFFAPMALMPAAAAGVLVPVSRAAIAPSYPPFIHIASPPLTIRNCCFRI